MSKHALITLVTFVAIAVGLVLASVAISSPVGPGPVAAPITINPLKSTLPNPSQLDSCVNKAIQYTQATYPSDQPISVFLKRQVTDKDLSGLGVIAPDAVGTQRGFGVLTNLVILHGHFKTIRSSGYVPWILYVLTPYPDCYMTITTFNVKAFGLK
jgi:hypothetical protein